VSWNYQSFLFTNTSDCLKTSSKITLT
jgi:hypothetical protein